MIEKAYSRPAIGDVVGYTDRPDLQDASFMQVRIEDTVFEIHIDPTKKEDFLRDHPPGSQVSANFYNCEWHIEGKAVDSHISRPRIGISIEALLKDHPAASGAEAKAVEAEPAQPEGEAVVASEELPDDLIASTIDYLDEIKVDFRVEADELLKSINLSHLKVPAH